MGKIIKNGVVYGGTSNIAGNISYDNTGTQLNAVTVQNAITELKTLVDAINNVITSLGDLATSDTASDTYTPVGTVTITPTTSNIEGMATVGTLPIFTYDSTTKNLTYTDGTLPTKATAVSAMTEATASFTGTEATITVSGD
jgi:hypothetical protein